MFRRKFGHAQPPLEDAERKEWNAKFHALPEADRKAVNDLMVLVRESKPPEAQQKSVQEAANEDQGKFEAEVQAKENAIINSLITGENACMASIVESIEGGDEPSTEHCIEMVMYMSVRIAKLLSRLVNLELSR